MTAGRCYRCGEVRDDVATRYELGAFFLCDPCAALGHPSGLTGTPPLFRGLERAAHAAQIVAEDERAGVPWERTVANVRRANALTFEPPFRAGDLDRLLGANPEGDRRG